MGGDAQVATQIVLHDVGAAFIFRDPIGTSAAACDCDALLRLINVHNIMNATNSASADMLVQVLAEGLRAPPSKVGEILPSFVQNLESPAVAAYVAKQTAVIAAHSADKGSRATEARGREPPRGPVTSHEGRTSRPTHKGASCKPQSYTLPPRAAPRVR